MLFSILSTKVTCLVAVCEPKIAEIVINPPEPWAVKVDGALVVLLSKVVFELFQYAKELKSSVQPFA